MRNLAGLVPRETAVLAEYPHPFDEDVALPVGTKWISFFDNTLVEGQDSFK